ncbi:MAG TPA: hypothetical protein VK821_10125 [Dehalococcoidia bacterium]|nr:hypothetical protein [Dehalococcoidia bacterium]
MPCPSPMLRRLFAIGAIPLMGLGLFLAACGGGGGVNATANDFNFVLDKPHAPAGKVHVTLNNQSKTYQHEFWLYPSNQPKIQDLITAKDAGQDVNEGDYLQNIAGKVEDIDPGKSASFDANLAAGTYEYACLVTTNIGGKNQVHYELGMHGTLTVP